MAPKDNIFFNDCTKNRVLLVRSFGLGILGTRNFYIFIPSIFNAHSNVNITSSRNSEPKRTHNTSSARNDCC